MEKSKVVNIKGGVVWESFNFIQIFIRQDGVHEGLQEGSLPWKPNSYKSSPLSLSITVTRSGCDAKHTDPSRLHSLEPHSLLNHCTSFQQYKLKEVIPKESFWEFFLIWIETITKNPSTHPSFPSSERDMMIVIDYPSRWIGQNLWRSEKKFRRAYNSVNWSLW